MNLFLAIYHEHKDRTGHAILEGKPEYHFDSLHIRCNVCMHLKAENERLEKEYNESLEASR